MAAIGQFAERGYHNTTIQQIATAAGVSKGLIYNYFSSKEQLLDELFGYLEGMGVDMLTRYQGLAPVVQLERILDDTFAILESGDQSWKMILSILLQPDVSDKVKAFAPQVLRKKLDLMLPVLDQMGVPEPELMAYRLSALLDGITMGREMIGDMYPMAQMKAYIYNQFVEPYKTQ